MSKKEQAASARRLAELYKGLNKGNWEDYICAILMDPEIGDFGMHEETARAKVSVLMPFACYCPRKGHKKRSRKP
jgi:hypothetical protein